MTNKPPPPEAKSARDVQDEPGAEQRFAKGIANALKMPPKPHGKSAAARSESKKQK